MDYVWDITNTGTEPGPTGGADDVATHWGVRGRTLASLASHGDPVPPGFVVSDVACRRFLEVGELPAEMWEETVAAVQAISAAKDPDHPLVFAVRASPPVPMPGLLGRALHVGLNPTTLESMTRWGGQGFANRSRLAQLRGLAEMRKVAPHRIASVVGAHTDLDQRSEALAALIVDETQRPIPTDAMEQLREAIETVFASWDAEPARRFRRHEDISDDLGTAVIVHLMVFGDLGPSSGAGVALSRSPVSGEPTPTGVYVASSDVVPDHGDARSHDHPGLAPLEQELPEIAAAISDLLDRSERQTRDMVRLDFVVERSRLWVLDARSADRTGRAAVHIAVDLAESGVTTPEQAVLSVDPDGLEEMLHDRIRFARPTPPVLVGGAASPGAAVGEIVLDAETAVTATAAGRSVILVKRETTPEDLAGVVAAVGVLTSHGGPTSHASVAARGTGTPAVTGAADLEIDASNDRVRIGSEWMTAGTTITLDGSTGSIYPGALELDRATDSVALDTLLRWADDARRLQVWANADTPDAAANARSIGAEGVGLARTEYMFSGERLSVVQRVILSDDLDERTTALEELEDLQIGDFERLLESMDGLPVVVRLLDPPLHEFLPDRWEVDAELGTTSEPTEIRRLERLRRAIDLFEESNPMLGLRGVRLAVVIPEIYRVQVLAALEAVRRRLDADGDPRLELMIPLVGSVEELHLIRDMIDEEVHYAGRQLDVAVGTMIELPRAALVAGDLALDSDFFSFGTNDLTQTTLGISRDDAEEAFLRTYIEQGILRSDPFTTIDRTGVGRLIEMAIAEGRAVNPGLVVGVCGEHGGDPASIDFFHEVGLDYVSCSPPRIPVARLAAAQAALRRM